MRRRLPPSVSQGFSKGEHRPRDARDDVPRCLSQNPLIAAAQARHEDREELAIDAWIASAKRKKTSFGRKANTEA